VYISRPHDLEEAPISREMKAGRRWSASSASHTNRSHLVDPIRNFIVYIRGTRYSVPVACSSFGAHREI